jgi:chemotaxis protein MotB
MMAFFLLMWLLAMVSPEKRAAVSEYFKHYTIFEKSGGSIMQGAPKILQQPGGDVKAPGEEIGKGAGEVSPEYLKERLKKAVEEKLKALKDQVMVDIFEGGVRIQLVDTEGSLMFPSGSAQPSERARQILKLVAENIKNTHNRITVEGHTDAAPLKSGQTTNWELSTGRASSARRELESNGIDPGRIARVVGYADTEPLIRSNPHDPRNRRISIILMQAKTQPPAPRPAPETPEPQLKAVQPAQPPVEQIQKTLPPQPAPQAEKKEIKQEMPVKAVQPAKPAEKVSKPPAETAAKTGQKKGISDSDIGIKSKKPIDLNRPSITPEIGKGH